MGRELLIYIVGKSTSSLVLIRLVLTEIQRFKNFKIKKRNVWLSERCVRTASSLRSWRCCRRARNNVLAAEPPEASSEAARKSLSPLSSRLRSPLACRLLCQNFISRALTIPPATQAGQRPDGHMFL